MKRLVYLIGAIALMAVAAMGYDYRRVSSPLPAPLLAEGGAQAAPDIALKADNGELLHWSSIKSPYILVNFWAGWCGPCKQEMPLLAALAAKYPQQLTLVMLSVDDSAADMHRFVQQLDAQTRQQLSAANVIMLHDTGRDVSRTFQVYRYPESYLLGPERTIMQKITGPLHANDLPTLQ